MKRLFIFMLILLPILAFASGGKQTTEITLAGASAGPYLDVIAIFESRYDVKVTHIDIDVRTGTAITMDALLAAGTPPDVYLDFIGRSGKYVRADYALPLDIDESLYVTDILNLCKRDGVLYALPQTVPGQAMSINTGMTKGWVPDADWTIEDFIDACKVIKSQAADGYYATGLFAANPSGDYLYVNWFGAFGVELFKDGDYSRSNANTPQGIKAFTFLKMLYDEGFVNPAAPSMTDDDYVEEWVLGKQAFAPMRPSWINGYIPGAIASGKIDKEPTFAFVPFPHDPSIAGTPTAGGGGIVVARKTDDPEKAKMLTDLCLLLTGTIVANQQIVNEGFPTRTDVTLVNPNKYEQVVRDIAGKFGFMDVGYANSWYYENRAVMPEVLRDLYNGLITPTQAANIYADRVDAIIAEAAK